MPRRPLSLGALTTLLIVLSACADVGSPTQPSSLARPVNASFDANPGTCKGGWNSSTGRC
jgi:hypothetical protein